MHDSNVVLGQYSGQHTGIADYMRRVAAATVGEGNMFSPKAVQEWDKAPTAAGDKCPASSLCNGFCHFQGAPFNATLLQGGQNLQNDWRA
ncbi:hypothetical protein AA18895_0196 [Acetobacter ghanensis DSM 18895]|nr:hypothetical protein AA18895_0196 [Acetobacter ghanensis DSM 18895]